MSEPTLHQLIKDCYPAAASCISSLSEIIKTNHELTTEVLELAIMIGINSAMIRINWDKTTEVRDKLKGLMFEPKWYSTEK